MRAPASACVSHIRTGKLNALHLNVLGEAHRHIKTYESPEDCVWLYARALATFGRYGDKKTSQKALAKALLKNVFAAARLLGEAVPPGPEPETDDDADMCAEELASVWSEDPGSARLASGRG